MGASLLGKAGGESVRQDRTVPVVYSRRHPFGMTKDGAGRQGGGGEGGKGGRRWNGVVGLWIETSRVCSDKLGCVTPLWPEGHNPIIRPSPVTLHLQPPSRIDGVRPRAGPQCPPRPSPRISSDLSFSLAHQAWANPPCSPGSSRTTQQSSGSVSLVRNHSSSHVNPS